MMRRTITMTELLGIYERRDRAGREQETEARRARFDSAQATGRVVLLDPVMPHDPEGALLMLLIGSSCGHLIRLPLAKEDLAAIVGYARSEGIIL